MSHWTALYPKVQLWSPAFLIWWPDSESSLTAHLHGGTLGGVDGILKHSCSAVKLLLVVYTHPIELDWFIAAHRPATVVLVQGALQRDARGSA